MNGRDTALLTGTGTHLSFLVVPEIGGSKHHSRRSDSVMGCTVEMDDIVDGQAGEHPVVKTRGLDVDVWMCTKLARGPGPLLRLLIPFSGWSILASLHGPLMTSFLPPHSDRSDSDVSPFSSAYLTPHRLTRNDAVTGPSPTPHRPSLRLPCTERQGNRTDILQTPTPLPQRYAILPLILEKSLFS